MQAQQERTHQIQLWRADYNQFLPHFETTLAAIAKPVIAQGTLAAAAAYALLGGGKRLRAYLVFTLGRLLGTPQTALERIAAATECLHAYTLVHDDLPAMDDDDWRRGQQTVHKAYDEATAILVGDGLQAAAFEILADPRTHQDGEIRAALTCALARAGGFAGVVEGQARDLAGPPATRAHARITAQKKTGVLFAFTAQAACLAGAASPQARKALIAFAQSYGAAFQVADDLSDAEREGDGASLLQVQTREQVQEHLQEMICEACARLDFFGAPADTLKGLVQALAEQPKA